MKKNPAAVLIVFVLMTVIRAQASPSAGAPEKPRIRILTTVFPLMEFARETAGERGEVALLLPPGAEVHTWQPKVSDIRKLGSYDVFIYIGRGLEPWADDILKGAARPGLKIFEVGRELQSNSPGSERVHRTASATLDPHIWLDFGLDLVLIDRLRDLFRTLDPENAGLFERNAARYKERLRRLDDQCRQAFGSCLQKTFIFGGHEAFGHFARRYGLEQIAVYGLSPDAAPTPKELAAIMTEAKKRNIRTIFFEPGVSDKMARLIAGEIGADIRLINPGHNLTKAQMAAGVTFIDLMESNLESFKHGLACR